MMNRVTFTTFMSTVPSVRVRCTSRTAASGDAWSACVSVTLCFFFTPVTMRVTTRSMTKCSTHRIRNANAITHAESSCRLRVSLTPSTLRVNVIDTGAGTPEPQPPSATEEHGRGLHLVAAVTTAWGLEIVPDDGKVVWAELARPA